VLDSQGAFVAGTTRRTMWRTPTGGIDTSTTEARSREVSGRGGRFEPRVVHSNHVRGRTLRLDAAGGNVGGGLRERRTLPGVCVTEDRPGPVNVERPSREGSSGATASRPEHLVEEWLSGHSEASCDGREVDTTDARRMQAARRWRHLCAARRSGP
jgi:hypothetical protein